MLTTILFIILIILLYLFIKQDTHIQESFMQKKPKEEIIKKDEIKKYEKINFKNNFKNKSKKSNYKKWSQHTDTLKKRDCTECKK